MRVLITRPAEDAAATALAVRARGHEPVIAPLSTIRYATPAQPHEAPSATIFTSRNAVRALGDAAWSRGLCSLPAYCVGAATAQAAREAGFNHVIGGGGTGAQLAEHIAYIHAEGGPLLYLTGDHLAFDMQSSLAKRGISVLRHVVYHSETVPAFPENALEALRQGRLDGVLLMSPRTAAHFARLAEQAGVAAEAAKLTCYCLSNPVVAALDHLRPAEVLVADAPTHAALIDLLPPSASA